MATYCVTVTGVTVSDLFCTPLLRAVLDGGELLLLLPELGVLALQHLLLLRQRRRKVQKHHLEIKLETDLKFTDLLSVSKRVNKQGFTERNMNWCPYETSKSLSARDTYIL